MRFLVTFQAADGTRHEVSVWAPSAESATNAARTWLTQAQELELGGDNVGIEVIGSEPSDSDLGIAVSNEAISHQRFGRSGEPMSTFFQANPDHIQRLTRRLREDDGAEWARARALLTQHDLDPSQVAVASSAPDGPIPPRTMTLVARDGRVFSLFMDAHPRMEGGLPVLTADASFVVEPGPALIEIPRDVAPDRLANAASALLKDEMG